MTHQKLEIKELISSFQDYLTYEKGLSENTVYAYKSDIIKFTQYADLNNLNKNVISKYFFELSEFNYSNNPSYVTGSLGQLVFNSFKTNPQTYITSVGLYNDRRELLAVAKLSKPLPKDFTKESLIKVKIDY